MSQQYIIYADSDKCRGCKKCELACIASHNGVTIKEAAKLRKDHEPRVHVVKTDTLKMPCPYGAISRTFVEITEDEKTRLARKDPRLISVRCDLCEQWRASEGKEVSACVEACAFGALRMMPLEEYRALMHGEALSHTALEKEAPSNSALSEPKPEQ